MRSGATLAVLLVACSPSGSRDAPALVFAPLGEPLPTATGEQLAAFERGRALALRRFVASEGLGPEMSATACGACHERPVPGGSASRYRGVFARVRHEPALFIEVQPQFAVGPAARAPDAPDAGTTVRSPIPFFGVGLLAEIPVEVILARSDPRDVDADGISGRPNFERGFVGRFGRKAQLATLSGLVRLALLDHLGLTTDPLPPEIDAVPGPIGLPTADQDGVDDPELAEADLEDLVAFVGLLAAPEPAPPTAETERGRAVFADLGCVACHAPALDGPRGPLPAYTDLLLHDLGPGLADELFVGEAEATEHRTQPLWGLPPAGPYLHDGRADTIDEAILWHGGEAEPSRDRYAAGTDEERAAVVAFLRSLGGRGDVEAGDAEAPLELGEIGGPRRSLDPDSVARFDRGRRLFDRDTSRAAGRGPGFNGDACRSCHFDGAVGGAGPSDVDVIRQAVLGSSGPEAPPSGTMAHRFQLDGTRPGIAGDILERRQTPSALGLGLVDEIPERAIVARADPDDADGDGIHGRAHRLADGRLGRFGWKAGVASLEDFVRDALVNELGVTVDDARDADGVPDPEMGESDVADLTFFLRELAPPPAEAAAEDAGQVMFARLGCAHCHVPVLETEDGTPVPLYSDLLLHDVAPPDRAFVPDGEAGSAFRTPPLWGLALSAPYLHDGSAESVEAAVLGHDREARSAREAFAALDPAERAALMAFLRGI